MLNNNKEKYTTLCISDETGRMKYEELSNKSNIQILNESRHWEGGSYYVALKYIESSRLNSDNVDLPKNNGIPSNENNNKDLKKLKELSEN